MTLEFHIDDVMQSLAWEHNPHLAVAVSGGADSVALALLMQHWVMQRSGRISALIVDHGLRSESADEAHQTLTWLMQRGIEAHILSLELASSPDAMQERARLARYVALGAWCRQQDVLHLMVGHHQGDQAETMLFRLTRDSGLSGLAAMPLVREQDGIRLIRPLLGVSKAQLQSYLHGHDQAWLHDPSNDNTRFTRIQFRKMLGQLPLDTIVRCAALAEGFGHWRHAYERQLHDALCRWVTPSGCGALEVDQHIAILPHTLQQAIWQAVLDSIGNQSTPPRGVAIERLIHTLSYQSHYALHGCEIIFNPQSGCWVVSQIPHKAHKERASDLEAPNLAPYMKHKITSISENHETANSMRLKPLAHAPFSAMT